MKITKGVATMIGTMLFKFCKQQAAGLPPVHYKSCVSLSVSVYMRTNSTLVPTKTAFLSDDALQVG